MDYMVSKRYIKLMTQVVLIALGIFFFFFGEKSNNYGLQVWGLIFLWSNNIVYSLYRTHERSVFLLLNITFFVLLLSRPFIAIIRNSSFWYFPPEHINFALNGIFISLLFLFLGCVLSVCFLSSKNYPIIENSENLETTRYLFASSFLAYAVSITCTFVINVEKFLYAYRNSYLEYHSGFSSKLPFFINAIALFSTFALCIVLATFPKKKTTVLILAMYILSAIPVFLMGSRNSLVLNVLFSLVYFIIRDLYDRKNKWIGKKEKILLGLSIPPGLIVLGAMNYLRADENVAPKGLFSLIIDFFYKQGASFDTLCIGHKFMDKLPFSEMKLYTFGPFLDAVNYGVISQKLFGMRSMNEGNNYYRGIASYQFANNLDYVSRWKDFFEGHGFGSSFILETYSDWGYVGVAAFSLLLGISTLLFVFYCRKNKPFLTTIILISLTNFFFLPRDSATRWLVFIIKPSFWICMLGCIMLAYLFYKNKKIFRIDKFIRFFY